MRFECKYRAACVGIPRHDALVRGGRHNQLALLSKYSAIHLVLTEDGVRLVDDIGLKCVICE